MKLIIDKDRFQESIVATILWVLAYFGTKFFNGFLKVRPYEVFIFSFESRIPFIPELFPLYFLAVPIVFLPLVIIKNKDLFKKTIKAYLVNFVISGLFYLVYPTKIPRPPIIGDEIYHQTINFFYGIIPAYNLIPSFHASLLTLSTLVIRRENKKIGNFLIILTTVILITTLFVKEHYLIDLITGVILSILIYKVILK